MWRDLFCGHLGLLLVAAALLSLQHVELWLNVAAGVLGALLFGYIHADIQLFLHEAAHYNIAKNRKTNDLLANIFIGALAGQDIRKHRPIHMMHHRYLGTTQDSERSYFDALKPRFIAESLTGIRALKVRLNHNKLLAEKPDADGKQQSYSTIRR